MIAYNSTEYQPNPDEQESQWQELVNIKRDTMSLMNRIMNAATKVQDGRSGCIALEQSVDDALSWDARIIAKFFDDGRVLPMSPMQAEWLRDSMPKRIVSTNPGTVEL